MPDPQPFFALTAAGLEALSAREIAMQPCTYIKAVSYRRISATCAGSLASLLSLRTVDDVFLELANWTPMGRPRNNLERLRNLASSLDLYTAAASCAELRTLSQPPTFSVSVSFVGKRNYTAEEIKTILASEVAHRHGWRYQHDDRLADLNLRLFLEHETAVIGIRLSKSPLHDRPYQQSHLPGALKPSVAAALVSLAGVTSHTSVLDPCCGSGTILIEAALCGASVYGGDNNPAALAAACVNCASAHIAASLCLWDACSLPFANASIDRIICNLPWGRQVAIEENPSQLHPRILAEMSRVLAPGGRIVLLTSAPDVLDPFDFHIEQRYQISLYGQRPTILVLSRPP